MTEHWLDTVPGRFGRDYSLQHDVKAIDAMIVHIVIFDTRRILLLQPTDSDDGAIDTSDDPRDGSMTIHSFALHPKIDADMTVRDQVLRGLSGAIQDGVPSDLQISEYCCDNYLHEIRKHRGDEIGTLHLVVREAPEPVWRCHLAATTVRNQNSIAQKRHQTSQRRDSQPWPPHQSNRPTATRQRLRHYEEEIRQRTEDGY